MAPHLVACTIVDIHSDPTFPLPTFIKPDCAPHIWRAHFSSLVRRFPTESLRTTRCAAAIRAGAGPVAIPSATLSCAHTFPNGAVHCSCGHWSPLACVANDRSSEVAYSLAHFGLTIGKNPCEFGCRWADLRHLVRLRGGVVRGRPLLTRKDGVAHHPAAPIGRAWNSDYSCKRTCPATRWKPIRRAPSTRA